VTKDSLRRSNVVVQEDQPFWDDEESKCSLRKECYYPDDGIPLYALTSHSLALTILRRYTGMSVFTVT
jgi:hypothetical protein